MLRHKNIDRICCAVLAATLILTCCFMGAAASGVVTGNSRLGYEDRLFDQSRVHTIDIVMDDWEGFLDTCQAEEYTACTVIIDGESFAGAGIRGKGNTSLSSVAQYGNDRYSFKIEFDHYQSGKTYYGLDKLSLNNLIQDKTCLKDYIAYTLMNRMGVAAPLCSFAQISVNGEAWGFYLAAEGVEDGFLRRNYGSDYGELYKPDSMSMGGGRGNGRDFDMDDFSEEFADMFGGDASDSGADTAFPGIPGGFEPGTMGEMPSGMPGAEIPEGFEPFPAQMPGANGENAGGKPENSGRGGFGGDGRGSEDVRLQYIDDDPSSYSNIFGNAKTDIDDADRARLINSLKVLSEGMEVESVVDTEAVIRYFAVHNFLCNDDSYTGQMIHNYYLYEEDGVMSMIPWDYNLAFGGFGMGGHGTDGATDTVNTPIDSLVSTGDIETRPMAAWIAEDAAYMDLYHEIYGEFLETVFESGWFETEMTRVIDMIAPFVERDENAFFTYDEFCRGTESLLEFCSLRARSIAGQLDGTIPSTTEAQRTDSGALIDASHIDLSDMGEFGMGGGKGDRSGFPTSFEGAAAKDALSGRSREQNSMPGGMNGSFAPSDEQTQIQGGMPAIPGGINGGFAPSDEQTQIQGGMPAIPGGMNGGFAPADDQAKAQGGMPAMPAAMPEGGAGSAAVNSEGQEPAETETVEAIREGQDETADSGTAEPARENAAAGKNGRSGTRNVQMSGASMESGGAASEVKQWAMPGGSMLLLVLAIVFAKRFKGNL